VAHDGVETDLTLPFERIRCAEAFDRWVGLDLLASIRPDGTGDAAALRAKPDESWEDAFFRHLLDHVEPHLGRDRGSFLTHWPAPQAALARRDPNDPRVALRFEMFAGGIELANAFDELTDPTEQRARFAHDVAERTRLYGAENAWPVDEDFLAALDHGMPSGSGIALGFDRLAMLASGARRIEDVLWLGGFPHA
jgi:lysyl-tRNA synthetase class 2